MVLAAAILAVYLCRLPCTLNAAHEQRWVAKVEHETNRQ